MNDQDLTKADYDPDRSLVLIEGLSHFLTNFLQNLASCQTSLTLSNMNLILSAQALGLVHNQLNVPTLNFTILSVYVILKLQNSKFVSPI
jgi:hypothetical protein